MEAAHDQADADLAAEPRQVGRVSLVSAVHGPARTPAVRAAAAGPRAVRGGVEGIRTFARDPLDVATRHGTKLVHAPGGGTAPSGIVSHRVV